MRIDVLSLFPQYCEGPLRSSMLGRAIRKGLIQVSTVDIRDFAERSDRRVDDRPFGGGPGMVLMAGPVVSAIRSCRTAGSRVIYLSPQGRRLSPSIAKELAQDSHLIFLCGHYEGVDQRAVDSDVDDEISIGDYVLTNGCLAALVVIDAVVRFVPGVLGDAEAAGQDSFEHGIFDHPHYTQPRLFEGVEVPPELVSGNHSTVDLWRRRKALETTLARRPDLVATTFLADAPRGEGGVDLAKLVVPSFFLHESLSFYRHLFGVSPDSACTFTMARWALQLIPAESELRHPPLLSLRLPPQQFRKAVSWATKRSKIVQEGEQSVTVLDPDGRLVRIFE